MHVDRRADDLSPTDRSVAWLLRACQRVMQTSARCNSCAISGRFQPISDRRPLCTQICRTSTPGLSAFFAYSAVSSFVTTPQSLRALCGLCGFFRSWPPRSIDRSPSSRCSGTDCRPGRSSSDRASDSCRARRPPGSSRACRCRTARRRARRTRAAADAGRRALRSSSRARRRPARPAPGTNSPARRRPAPCTRRTPLRRTLPSCR